MRQKLVESFYKDWKDNKISIEKVPLTESNSEILVEGKSVKSLGAYIVPIWKLDKKNLNERVYKTKLGEKVVKEQKVTYALADHPKDDGSVNNIKAVGRNPFIKNKILYAECHFVDKEFHEKVERLIELGVGIGLSSSSYGEVDDDTGEVIEEGFELERYFDFVLQPSYEVFLDGKATEVKESAEKTDTIIEKTEKVVEMSKPKSKLEETVIRNSISESINKILSLEGLDERINNLQGLIDNLDEDYVKDLREKAENELNTLLETKTELAVKGLKVDSLEEEKKTLAEKYQEAQEDVKSKDSIFETVCEDLDNLKENYKKVKKICESMQSKLKESIDKKDFVEAVDYISIIETENKSLKKQVKESNSKVRSLQAIQERIKSFEINNIKKQKETAQISKREQLLKEQEQRKLDNLRAIEENKERMFENISRREADLGFSIRKDVLEYYRDILTENPDIAIYKDRILNCSSIVEAQKLYMKLSSLMESDYSYNEKSTIKESYDYSDLEDWDLNSL